MNDGSSHAGASGSHHENGDINECGADLTLPTVATTVAHTNCGDRIQQGDTFQMYTNMMASRFSTTSVSGTLKTESFKPTGGGTDDGGTLAHVTVAHQLDANLRAKIYSGNPSSIILVGIDLMTHCGRDETSGYVRYGVAQESQFRHARAACGLNFSPLACRLPFSRRFLYRCCCGLFDWLQRP